MTTFTKAQYKEVVLVLENEGAFYQRYGAQGLRDTNDTYGKRRSIIGQFLSTRCGAYDLGRPLLSWPAWVGRNDIEDRDQIRRYFDDHYNVDQVEPNKYAHIPSVWDEPKFDTPKYAGLLQDAAITLENDPMFCKAYSNCCGLGGDHRRTTIERFLKKYCSHFYPAAVLDVADYLERLRLYFDSEIIPHHPCKSGMLSPREAIEFWRDEVRHPEDCARHKAKHSSKMSLDKIEAELTVPQPQPENIMTKPITITTKTFANGVDIATMADADVYSLIAEQEAEIEKLKAIKARPNKLVAEIAKREAGIVALVAYLDKTDTSA